MISENNNSGHVLAKMAFIGNYLPRRCGIAAFTTDLCEAVSKAEPDVNCFAVAMNDRPEGYAYPNRVRLEVESAQREQYDLAADFLNVNQVDVLCVQHEYGIYGGRMGGYLLPLLRRIRAPIVTTLHTILESPSPDQRYVMEQLAHVSDRLVVMSERASRFLKDIYGAPEAKIRLIHHGIPDMPFVDPNFYKDRFGAEGRRTILTFGLLSPNKGIEYMVDALPNVIKRYPDILYLILGATHPDVKRERGEAYRLGLEARVRERGCEEHVVFINRFVEFQELCEYLGAADIYVTPYLNAEQIVSGTLAYAMGTGKAVVSTPYWYAEDMLADGRGRIVPFRDPHALAETLTDLLEHEPERHAMRKRAYQMGRSMIWPEVARQYIEVFNEAREERIHSPRKLPAAAGVQHRVESLPELNPQHFLTLTDSVGILQHALYTVPDPHHGYSTDDQARALIVAVKANQLRPLSADWELLEARYLSFLLNAFDPVTCRFNNFLNYQRQWIEQPVTEDVHGRAVWALANVVAFSANEGHRNMAAQLLDQTVPPTASFSSPRAWALSILATQIYLRRFSGASAFRKERQDLARKLFDQFKNNATDDWPWLEGTLTYANALLPQALIEAGQWIPNPEMTERGLAVLRWLDTIQTSEAGCFMPVGTNGWYARGSNKARFDQQPIEAYTMLDACVTAYRCTSDPCWLKTARRAFDWFIGRNDLGIPLCDYRTGGCYDGLHPDRVNQNQGAESTIVWLLSLLLMHELQAEMNGNE
jgi:glycosyltransferase involved in cell wall biosynthesis